MEEHTINLGERGTYDKRNKLNHLTSKEWLKFTKSWFVHYPPPRTDKEILHPAKFPETMVKGFIEFFTKEGHVVLDPFLGTGSTLVACESCNRKGIGIELLEKYAKIASRRVKGTKQTVITGDSSEIDKFNLPKIDFIITSPPYGPMLNKTVGEVQRDRRSKGLDTNYSDNKNDLGNVQDYDEFIKKLVGIFKKSKMILKPNAYIAVILQNYIDGKDYRTLAWDFGKEMAKHFTLKGEKLWLQDNKTLYPYGYRWSYIPNVHHHYCLIFKYEAEK